MMTKKSWPKSDDPLMLTDRMTRQWWLTNDPQAMIYEDSQIMTLNDDPKMMTLKWWPISGDPQSITNQYDQQNSSSMMTHKCWHIKTHKRWWPTNDDAQMMTHNLMTHKWWQTIAAMGKLVSYWNDPYPVLSWLAYSPKYVVSTVEVSPMSSGPCELRGVGNNGKY